MSTPAGPTLGPCVSWCSGQDVAACRGDTTASDFALYDDVAVEASMLLFEVTGRQFSGLCDRTVRPCRDGCSCWSRWIPADVALPWEFGAYGGYGFGWWNRGSGSTCGCAPLSRVLLPGYPVREIVEVKIGGDVLAELDDDGNPNWRLDGWRWLTRMAAPGPPVQTRRWPGCQTLDLDDDQPGTFSVSYRAGVSPPPLGVAAAAQLASELYNACGNDGGDCRLPDRVTRIVRQGLTVDRVITAAAALRQGNSGIPLLDSFIAGYPGTGRRPAVWSPDGPRYARTVGT